MNFLRDNGCGNLGVVRATFADVAEGFDLPCPAPDLGPGAMPVLGFGELGWRSLSGSSSPRPNALGPRCTTERRTPIGPNVPRSERSFIRGILGLDVSSTFMR
jgi:hypothetical protein